jgi:hypothetical protein
MEYINPLVLILGGILAVSGLIVSKKPDAKALIDKLTPYQAVIGVALLALGVFNLIRGISNNIFSALNHYPFLAGVFLAVTFCSIGLGFLFGMPQIAKWIPGDSPAEQKAMELSAKLAPYQLIIGGIGIAASLLSLLISFHIIKPN